MRHYISPLCKLKQVEDECERLRERVAKTCPTGWPGAEICHGCPGGCKRRIEALGEKP